MTKQRNESKNRDDKVLFLFSAFVSLLLFAIFPVSAEDPLSRWAAEIEKPEVQQAVLDHIFPGQIGPVSSSIPPASKQGTPFFPKGSSWVQLGKDVVLGPRSGGSYLVVSCTLYYKPDRDPVNTATYLFLDPLRRPTALTAGYASYERVQRIQLPKLDKSFLVVVDRSSNKGGSPQWSASLLEIRSSGMTDHPPTAWLSPMSARVFQFRFDDLGSREDALHLRTI